MAASSNLKLLITTALDNAGIRATKDQISQLQQQMQQIGKGTTNAVDSVAKLPGKLGGIASKATGIMGTVAKIGGTITAIFESFELGRHLGEQIREKIGEWIPAFETVNQKMAHMLEQENEMKERLSQQVDAAQKVDEAKQKIFDNDMKRMQQISIAQKRQYTEEEGRINRLNTLKDTDMDDNLKRMKLAHQQELQSMQGVYDEATIAQTKAYMDYKELDAEKEAADSKYFDALDANQRKANSLLEQYQNTKNALSKAEMRYDLAEQDLAKTAKTDRGARYQLKQRRAEKEWDNIESLLAQADSLESQLKDLAVQEYKLNSAAAFGSEEFLDKQHKAIHDINRLIEKDGPRIGMGGSSFPEDVFMNEMQGWFDQSFKAQSELQSDALAVNKQIRDILYRLEGGFER